MKFTICAFPHRQLSLTSSGDQHITNMPQIFCTDHQIICQNFMAQNTKVSFIQMESQSVQQGPVKIPSMFGQAECCQVDPLIALGKTSMYNFLACDYCQRLQLLAIIIVFTIHCDHNSSAEGIQSVLMGELSKCCR